LPKFLFKKISEMTENERCCLSKIMLELYSPIELEKIDSKEYGNKIVGNLVSK